MSTLGAAPRVKMTKSTVVSSSWILQKPHLFRPPPIPLAQYYFHRHFFMCFHFSIRGNVPPHSSPGSTALALDPGLGCVPGVTSLSAGNL